jgi:hypothetical protein
MFLRGLKCKLFSDVFYVKLIPFISMPIRYTTATRAVIIGAPEPVFAAVAAYLLYDEGMFSVVNYIGAALMLAGVLFPLVHEEARVAVLDAGLVLPIHSSSAPNKEKSSPSAGGSSHSFQTLGHFNNSIHFVHHSSNVIPAAASSSDSRGMRRRNPEQSVVTPSKSVDMIEENSESNRQEKDDYV